MPVSTTIGCCRISVMSDDKNDPCHFQATHFVPNVAAKRVSLDASV